jgi:high-affinity iron transporter
MIASLLLSLREGVEAALIIGIVLAVLGKTKQKELRASVWQGAVTAIVISIFAGLVFTWIGAEFTGRGEQIFEGTAMIIAVIFLTWMIVWLKQQSGSMGKRLEAEVNKASRLLGSRSALFGLSFLAIGREGFELVLFLTAIQMTAHGFQTIFGAVLGLAVAAVFGWVMFTSSKRLNLRYFFGITNVLLVLFAAGMLARGVHEFNEAGIIPAVVEQVWNINPIVDESRSFGQFLVALFGYNGDPSLTEILAYGLYLISAFLYLKKHISMNTGKSTTGS